jgi:integrase/recombinase XerD
MDRLDQLFQQFLRERTFITNVTPKTIAWYESAWKAFKRARASTSPRLASAPLISRADLQSFVVHLRERGVRPVSCNTWLRALNAFCRWLHEQGEIPAAVKLAPQRLEKRIIRTHDEPALRVILTNKPKTFAHWRIHALVSTILDTGCRIDEVLTARTTDFDFPNLLVTVYGRSKGTKERGVARCRRDGSSK